VLSLAFQTLTPDSEWLARVEQSRLANPRSMELQYLSGMVCLRHSLWGKAQQLLEQAAPRLQSSELKRSAWRALAELAEQLKLRQTELNLVWVPRDQNEEADELTNEEFSRFRSDLRVDIALESIR
jgi:uncharacterized protein HemY